MKKIVSFMVLVFVVALFCVAMVEAAEPVPMSKMSEWISITKQFHGKTILAVMPLPDGNVAIFVGDPPNKVMAMDVRNPQTNDPMSFSLWDADKKEWAEVWKRNKDTKTLKEHLKTNAGFNV